jgi:uncharacterized membrane protein
VKSGGGSFISENKTHLNAKNKEDKMLKIKIVQYTLHKLFWDRFVGFLKLSIVILILFVLVMTITTHKSIPK